MSGRDQYTWAHYIDNYNNKWNGIEWKFITWNGRGINDKEQVSTNGKKGK